MGGEEGRVRVEEDGCLCHEEYGAESVSPYDSLCFRGGGVWCKGKGSKEESKGVNARELNASVES